MDDPLKGRCHRTALRLLRVVWLIALTATGVRAQTPPAITTVSPVTGSTGTAVTITGTNFGASQGTSTVTFAGLPATPTSWSNTQIVAPVPGSAIAFDDPSAALHRDGGYFDPTQDFTIAFWVKLTSHVGGPWRAIYVVGDAYDYVNPYIWIGTGSAAGPDNVVKFEAYNATDWIDIVTQPLTTNEWHYLVFTHDASSGTFTGYVDGELIDSLNLAMEALVEDDEYLANDEWLSASGLEVVHFRNWQATLTPAESEAEKVSVNAVRQTGLLTQSRLFGPADVADLGGQSRHWSVLGSPKPAKGPLVPGSAIASSSRSELKRDGGYLDPTQDFSIAIWFKLLPLVSGGSWRDVYVIGDGAWTNPYIWLGTGSAAGPDNRLTFEVWNGTEWLDIQSPELSVDQWHYGVLTHDATSHTFTAYVDGAVIGSGTATMLPFVEHDEHLGSRASTPGSAFAHVRMWQAALSSSEVAAEKVARDAVRSTNLLSDTPLAGLADVPDRSGNGRHWNVIGAPWSIRGPLVSETGPIVVTVDGQPSNAAMFGSVPPVLTFNTSSGSSVSESSVLLTGTIESALSSLVSLTCNGVTGSVTASGFSCLVALVPGSNTIAIDVLDQGGITSTLSTSLIYAPEIRYHYDLLGRLVQVIDQAGNAATYTYDAVGNVTAITRTSPGGVSISSLPPRVTGGSQLTIHGTGFSPLPSNNTVTVGGTTLNVVSATSTQLVVALPTTATSDTLTITTSVGGTASAPLTITAPPQPPTIAAFTPSIASAGALLTITGTGFHSTLSSNQVTFNGGPPVAATSGTATQIQVSIPPDTTSGKFVVTTPNGSAVSASDLFVAPSPFAAADVDAAGRLTLGQSQAFAITTANHIGLAVFDGAPGRRVFVLGTGVAANRFSLLHPVGVSFDWWVSGDPDVIPATAPATYTVVVNPSGASTGAYTLAVFDVPPDVTGTIAVGGSPVVVTTTTPGQRASLTFAGIAGQHLGVEFSNLSVQEFEVAVISPNGATVEDLFVRSSYSFSQRFVDFVLPVTGSYSIVMDPKDAYAGSVTATLTEVPTDLTGSILPNGSPVIVNFTVPGQNARLTFTGVPGQRVSLHLSNLSAGLSTDVFLIRPDGSVANGSNTGGTFLDPILISTSGTYTILIDPRLGGTGSVTVALYDVPPNLTGTIEISGPPVSLTFTNPGQNATLTFAGAASERISLMLSGVTIAETAVTIRNPNGSTLASTTVGTTGGSILDRVLGSTGTYSIDINPSLANTGMISLTLANPADLYDAIAVGGPQVVVTFASAGTRAFLSFTGAVGQRVVVMGSAMTITKSTVEIRRPDGATLASGFMGPGWGGFLETPGLPVAGTYTVMVDPIGNYTGSITLQMHEANDVIGSLTLGTGFPVTFSTPGQNARLTFAVGSNQPVSLRVTGASGISGPVSILRPDGSVQATTGISNGAAFIDQTTLAAAGTYTAFIDPVNAQVGSLTVTVRDATDLTDAIVADGAAVTKTVTNAGQNVRLTFTGSAGQHVSVNATSVSIGGTSTLALLRPDGSTLSSRAISTSGGLLETVTLPTAGTFTVFVNPSTTNTGSATLRLYTVVDLAGTIVPGGSAVPLTVSTPGQNANYTFAGVAGQRVSLRATAVTIASSTVALVRPDATTQGSMTVTTSGGFLDTMVLAATGTYTVRVDPANANTGNLTLTLYNVPADVTGTLTIGAEAVPITIATSGQNASLTFTGTTSQQVTVRISSNAIGSVTVKLLRPDGSTQVTTTSSAASFNLAIQTLGTGGTYTVAIDPAQANVGNLSLRVTSP